MALVAVADEGLLGYIVFSRLELAGVKAAALGPLAVFLARQNQGVGATLTGAGLEACRALGVEAVVVLGHPEYYPRFGFSAALAERLEAPFSGPAYMALELSRGSLSAGGRVRYARGFELPDVPE